MKTGVILAERYRLDDPIAAGGVGQVWRATDMVLQRRVAVKLLRPEYADHPETLSRFQAEARHAGSLAHPAICQVYDYGDNPYEGPPYLVMELVDGPSLADVLVAEPVTPAYALDVLAKAASGLAAAHEAGVVHRDIKPGNILLGQDGQVKITDFGIAFALGSAPVTDPGLVMGTTQYLAPERIAGGSGTPAADLYSLGIVMHECLTGVPPYEGTPAEVMAGHLYVPLPPLPPGTPPEVEDLISRLCAKDPEQRLADAGELAALARRVRNSVTGQPMPRPRQGSGASPILGDPLPGDPFADGPVPGDPALNGSPPGGLVPDGPALNNGPARNGPVPDGPVLGSPLPGDGPADPVLAGSVVPNPVVDSPIIGGFVPGGSGPDDAAPGDYGPQGPVLAGSVLSGPVVGGPSGDGPVLGDPVFDEPVFDEPVFSDPVPGGYPGPDGHAGPEGHTDPDGYADPGRYADPDGYPATGDHAFPGRHSAGRYSSPQGYPVSGRHSASGGYPAPGRRSARDGYPATGDQLVPGDLFADDYLGDYYPGDPGDYEAAPPARDLPPWELEDAADPGSPAEGTPAGPGTALALRPTTADRALVPVTRAIPGMVLDSDQFPPDGTGPRDRWSHPDDDGWDSDEPPRAGRRRRRRAVIGLGALVLVAGAGVTGAYVTNALPGSPASSSTSSHHPLSEVQPNTASPRAGQSRPAAGHTPKHAKPTPSASATPSTAPPATSAAPPPQTSGSGSGSGSGGGGGSKPKPKPTQPPAPQNCLLGVLCP